MNKELLIGAVITDVDIKYDGVYLITITKEDKEYEITGSRDEYGEYCLEIW